MWPPVDPKSLSGMDKDVMGRATEEGERRAVGLLPPLEEQEELLELFFTYVHPSLPVVNRQQFMKHFYAR